MSNYTVSRLGQINGQGDTDALFLKKFIGEVLTEFDRTNVTMDKHFVRTIENGKSAQFPVIGSADAYYHTPGEEITGGKIKHAERVIVIDDMLIAPAFIANIDEAKNHYDVRSVYTKAMGAKLAKTMDQHVLQMGVLAARAPKIIDDEEAHGGATIYNVDPTDGLKFAEALGAAATTLDEKDIPEGERFAFVRPAIYNKLATTPEVLNKDWGGRGSYADGKIVSIAGITLIKTNNLPNRVVQNGTRQAGTNNKYAGDFSNTVGLVMTKMAVGTVKLLDLGMESEYKIERQGTLMVAKYAVGHDYLQPACAVELSTADAP